MASLVIDNLSSLDEEFTFPDLAGRKRIVRSASFQGEISPEEEIVKDNIETLKKVELPQRFKRSEVEEFFAEKIKKDLKGPFHQRALKIEKYASNFQEKHSRYFDTIFDFHEEVAKRLSGSILHTTKTYMISKLPTSFQRIMALSFITELKMLEVLDRRMRREKRDFLAFRGNRVKFDRAVQSHNRWIEPLLDIADDMIDKRTRLLWYLDFNGSASLSEIFKLKAYKLSDCDSEIYYSLLRLLQTSTQNLRNLLMKYDQEHYVPPFDTENPTTELYTSMAQILHG